MQRRAGGARSCDPVPERKRGRRLAASKINSKLKEPFQTEPFRCSISGATLTIDAWKPRREERNVDDEAHTTDIFPLDLRFPIWNGLLNNKK